MTRHICLWATHTYTHTDYSSAVCVGSVSMFATFDIFGCILRLTDFLVAANCWLLGVSCWKCVSPRRFLLVHRSDPGPAGAWAGHGRGSQRDLSSEWDGRGAGHDHSPEFPTQRVLLLLVLLLHLLMVEPAHPNTHPNTCTLPCTIPGTFIGIMYLSAP